VTTYRRLATAATPRRTYQISVGLMEGFSDKGALHNIKDAERVILHWIETRIKAGQMFLSGTLAQQAVLYGIGDQADAHAISEPVAVFSGFVSVRRTPTPSDDEVDAMLEELASQLGVALGQVRVNIENRDTTWVIEAEDTPLPREPHQSV